MHVVYNLHIFRAYKYQHSVCLCKITCGHCVVMSFRGITYVMSSAFHHCNCCHLLSTANSVLSGTHLCMCAPFASHPFASTHLPFHFPSPLPIPSPFLPQTSQPSVKEILFCSPSREEHYIARLNTIAAVFLLLQVQAELNEDICNIAFALGQKLVEHYFNDKLQVISPFHAVLVKCARSVCRNRITHTSKTTCTVAPVVRCASQVL